MSHASIIIALDKPGDIMFQVTEQMAPFDEAGESFKKETRWDRWTVGGRFKGKLLGRDSCFRSDITQEAMDDYNRQEAEQIWSEWEKEKLKDNKVVRDIYGFSDVETFESLTAWKLKQRISAAVFLHNKRWHENKRMGFFGGTTATECEIEAGRKEGKCIVGKIDKPPCIIGFNEEDERWGEHYFSRFLEHLSPSTTLVVVDYHV